MNVFVEIAKTRLESIWTRPNLILKKGGKGQILLCELRVFEQAQDTKKEKAIHKSRSDFIITVSVPIYGLKIQFLAGKLAFYCCGN